MEPHIATRKELLDFLDHGRTHAVFDDAIANLPENLINEKLDGVPYSFWGLLEHIRISQRDMIEFIRNPKYQDMEWPKDYWPAPGATATKAMWEKSVAAYTSDLAALKKIIKDPQTDLFVPIPWGDGQTIFREALQIIDHASYHTGEIVIMRRAKNDWQKGR